MAVRLTKRGVERTASASDLSAAKAEFGSQHSMVLRGFIEPDLLAAIQRQLAREPLLHKTNEGIGTELRLPPGPLSLRADRPRTRLKRRNRSSGLCATSVGSELPAFRDCSSPGAKLVTSRRWRPTSMLPSTSRRTAKVR